MKMKVGLDVTGPELDTLPPPGSEAARAKGCSCPADQPHAAENRLTCEEDCFVHGLDVVSRLLNEEGNANA